MNTNSALIVKNIYKKYGEKSILEDISFDVSVGDIFGLIGLNGIGKTTLIKIMMNLLSQNSGNVYFFGQDSNDYKSRKSVFYLPEKFMPSPFLKGWEFLSIALSYYDKEYKESEAQDYCKKFGLDVDSLYKNISSYSKGMSQKLGLISVFMSGAMLLVLDEPMSGLDPSARIVVKKQLKEYRQMGGTVFFSSHILVDVDEICNKVSIMHNKKIVFIGEPTLLLKESGASDMENAFLNKIGIVAA